MAATATVTVAATGSAGTLTATASANSITIDGGKVRALYVRVTAATCTFGYSAASAVVPLDANVWTEVWRREGGSPSSVAEVFFADSGAAATLYYRASD